MALGSTIALLKDRIAQSKSLTVLTGAGISADSGVPTFRGAEGLWGNFRAEDLATPEAFARNPRLVWEWYNWRRELIATTRPNPAHDALVELERRCERFRLITQNVDGLHRAAGSQELSEIHGNIWMVRCTACGSVEANHDIPIAMLPACRHCRALLRPHIVWFGEALSPDDLQRCIEALHSCDVMLVIGTSGVVHPAASFASLAKQTGAFVAEINLDPTPHSECVDLSLQGRAKDILPLLL